MSDIKEQLEMKESSVSESEITMPCYCCREGSCDEGCRCHKRNQEDQQAGKIAKSTEVFNGAESKAISEVSADLSLATGVELIRLERDRQLEVEGWSRNHDLGHDDGELSIAAARYAALEPLFVYRKAESAFFSGNDGDRGDRRLRTEGYYPAWPWGDADWKPKDRMRNLVRAGALIAAEIDRQIEAMLQGGSVSIAQPTASPKAGNSEHVPEQGSLRHDPECISRKTLSNIHCNCGVLSQIDNMTSAWTPPVTPSPAESSGEPKTACRDCGNSDLHDPHCAYSGIVIAEQMAFVDSLAPVESILLHAWDCNCGNCPLEIAPVEDDTLSLAALVLKDDAARDAVCKELAESLRTAIDLIRIWHGYGDSGRDAEVNTELWALYNGSPEMKRINAALAAYTQLEKGKD